MSDLNDEQVLRGYRPAGPPADLRARISSATASAERTDLREWLPALAAALLIVLFGTLSYRLQRDIDEKLTVPDDQQVVEQWISPEMEGVR